MRTLESFVATWLIAVKTILVGEIFALSEKSKLTTTWENVSSSMWSIEDSKQPERMRNLITVFVVRMKKLWIFGYPKCVQWRFWSECASWSESSLGVCSRRYVFLTLAPELHVLWVLDTFSKIFTIFDKGDNSCDFLFALLHIMSLLKRGLL